jgi:hypothetical protein
MSLQVEGVWEGGTWAATVWADDVWREGAVSESGGGSFFLAFMGWFWLRF